MDLLTALNQSWTSVFTLLEGLDEAQGNLPTPCAGWTVRDVAAHLGHIEGMGHGYPQPPTPDSFDAGAYEGFHALTEEGVAARRPLDLAVVLDEVQRAGTATLEEVSAYRDADWDEPALSPVGMVPARQAVEIRLSDVQVHLFDMRSALGMPISPDDEPEASAVLIARALRLAGWGAVKQAGLPDGTRIQIDLIGKAAAELRVEGGRGHVTEPEAETPDRISGPPLAFVLAAAGRSGLAEEAGGLAVAGEVAGQFLRGYRLFL